MKVPTTLIFAGAVFLALTLMLASSPELPTWLPVNPSQSPPFPEYLSGFQIILSICIFLTMGFFFRHGLKGRSLLKWLRLSGPLPSWSASRRWLIAASLICLLVHGMIFLLEHEAFLPNLPPDLSRAGGLWILCFGILGIPIVEEILFRGFLQGSMEESGWAPFFSVLAVSLVFVALHGQYDLVSKLLLLPIAFALSYSRYRMKDLRLTIAMHGVYNAGAFTFMWMAQEAS